MKEIINEINNADTKKSNYSRKKSLDSNYKMQDENNNEQANKPLCGSQKNNKSGGK